MVVQVVVDQDQIQVEQEILLRQIPIKVIQEEMQEEILNKVQVVVVELVQQDLTELHQQVELEVQEHLMQLQEQQQITLVVAEEEHMTVELLDQVVLVVVGLQ